MGAAFGAARGAIGRGLLCALLVLVPLLADRASAATVTLSSIDEGEYIGSSVSTRFSANFRASNAPLSLRSYFVFDLAGVTGTVTGARLFIPGAAATILGGAPILFSVFDVSTPAAVLLAGGDGASNIHGDLGSGALYGSAAVPAPPPDNNTGSAPMPDVSIALAGALGDIGGQRGGLFAVGGAVTGGGTTILWRGTSTSNPAYHARLTLEVTPEIAPIPLPPSVAMMAGLLGGLGLIGARRRRRWAARRQPS
jgi:hypothetical protein